jgi:hypothetical protein
MFDLKAIDAWLDARNGKILALTPDDAPRDAREVFSDRLARL